MQHDPAHLKLARQVAKLSSDRRLALIGPIENTPRGPARFIRIAGKAGHTGVGVVIDAKVAAMPMLAALQGAAIADALLTTFEDVRQFYSVKDFLDAADLEFGAPPEVGS